MLVLKGFHLNRAADMLASSSVACALLTCTPFTLPVFVICTRLSDDALAYLRCHSRAFCAALRLLYPYAARSESISLATHNKHKGKSASNSHNHMVYASI